MSTIFVPNNLKLNLVELRNSSLKYLKREIICIAIFLAQKPSYVSIFTDDQDLYFVTLQLRASIVPDDPHVYY